jgi:AcrR family transcriptional regulator
VPQQLAEVESATMARKAPTNARKGRPTALDARKKLAQVVAVASEQFSALGYRAVTMRGVAHEAHVSTRTLYNRYADKLSLFTACLDFESQKFPVLAPTSGENPDEVLEQYAADIVRALSTHSNLRLSMLIYRDGLEFKELLRAAEAHEDRLLIQPLASYLRQIGLEQEGSDELAKLFIAMALSQWQRRGSYRRPPPGEEDIVRHAANVVRTFLYGAKALGDRNA